MRVNRRTFAAAQIVPRTILAPLDFKEIFGRNARLEVDLGCGDGSFLVALAEQDPHSNFLGIDRLAGRVRGACRKIGDHRLTNARILQEDILYSVQQLLPPASVDVFHLMFPDPWPKRRHYGRRIVNDSFLRAIARALKPVGEFRVATDHADYFAAITTALQKGDRERLTISTSNDSLGIPLTTFEKRFHARGLTIDRIVLRRTN